MCPWVQVPFIKWLGDIPLAGAPMGGLVGSLAGPYANLFMGRTGQHLFLQDGSADAEPLLVRFSSLMYHSSLVYHWCSLLESASACRESEAAGEGALAGLWF